MEIKRGSTLQLSKRDLRDLERVANILNYFYEEIDSLNKDKIISFGKNAEISKRDIVTTSIVMDILASVEDGAWTCGEESEEV